MDDKTYIFTSKPITGNTPDSYHDIISDSILDGFRNDNCPAKIECAIRIDNQTIFIFIEIIADASIDASTIARNALNRLFQNTSLFRPGDSLSKYN